MSKSSQKKYKSKYFWHKPLYYNVFLILVLVLLFLLLIFSIFNFITILNLKQEMRSNYYANNSELNIPALQWEDRGPEDTKPKTTPEPEEGVQTEEAIPEQDQDFTLKEPGKPEQTTKSDKPTPQPEQAGTKELLFRSFGDSFSSYGYVDEDKTDIYLDETITSLSLPPEYSWDKVRSCDSYDCGLGYERPREACIANDCLSVKEKQLYFNQEQISLPNRFNNTPINSVTVGSLDTTWMVGVVTGQEEDKYGYVYEFDGTNFTSLITDTGEHIIKPKYGRTGGNISFGGTDDNFLIVYGGYDGSAFHVLNGDIKDVSRYFGLRVTRDIFHPKILKSGQGKDTTWYVCSYDPDEPKLIKLWQNSTLNIQGAVDLGKKVFSRDSRMQKCFLESEKKIGIVNNNQLWELSDLGFDNSQETRKITSVNLREKGEDRGVLRAIVEDHNINSNYNTNIYVSNDQTETWVRTEPNNYTTFRRARPNLHWKAEFKADPQDSFYSPWMGHLNQLNYFLVDS